MKYLLFISLLILAKCSTSQVKPAHFTAHQRDSIFIDLANRYIYKKLDSEFVKKNLKIVNVYLPAFQYYIVVYETITTKNPDGRNSIIIYFKNKFEVDTILSVLNKEQIMKSIKGDSSCTLLIGLEKAMEIAKSVVTKKSSIPWDIGVTFYRDHIPKWSLNITYSTVSHGGKGVGLLFNFNMTDGKYSEGYWTEEE
jgi:hypothetical protein